MQSTHCWTSPQLVVLLREVMEPLGVRVFLEKVSHRGGGADLEIFLFLSPLCFLLYQHKSRYGILAIYPPATREGSSCHDLYTVTVYTTIKP